MERQPMLTPFRVTEIETFDSVERDQETGKEIESQFHVVILKTLTQRINDQGNLTDEYRSVRKIVNNATLDDVKADFPIGATIPQTQYILVKNQRPKARTWEYYDRNGEKTSRKIDYEYEAVNPLIVKQLEQRDEALRQRLQQSTQRHTPANVPDEVGAPEGAEA